MFYSLLDGGLKPRQRVSGNKMSRELPLFKRNPIETWEDLKSPLNLDYIETEINASYMAPIRRLVGALIRVIRNLKDSIVEKIIKKPWGHENIRVKNDLYVVKQLFIRAGERLSLQYHKNKNETLMLVDGKATISRQPLVCHQHNPNLLPERMTPFQPYQVKPKTVHRIEAEEDTHIVEVSTPQLDDVVRLDDDYGRCEPDFELTLPEKKD